MATDTNSDQPEDLREMALRLRREREARVAARRAKRAEFDPDSSPEMIALRQRFEEHRKRMDEHFEKMASAFRF
jgi:hypothetical protein